MKVTVIIPARFSSTRLSGKPLILIDGKPLICHVVERVKGSNAVGQVVVATDSEKIRDALKESECSVFMSKKSHDCGTDRIAEATQEIEADFVVNVQGDQLIPDPKVIDSIIAQIDNNLKMATLYTDIKEKDELEDINVVKVVVNKEGNIIYMSRYPIPFNRGHCKDEFTYFKQVGIYVFSKECLLRFSALSPVDLELMEGIELLRALYYGLPLKGIYVDTELQDVNVSSDIEAAKKFVRKFPLN